MNDPELQRKFLVLFSSNVPSSPKDVTSFSNRKKWKILFLSEDQKVGTNNNLTFLPTKLRNDPPKIKEAVTVE